MADIGLMDTAKPAADDDYTLGRDEPFTWGNYMDAIGRLKGEISFREGDHRPQRKPHCGKLAAPI